MSPIHLKQTIHISYINSIPPSRSASVISTKRQFVHATDLFMLVYVTTENTLYCEIDTLRCLYASHPQVPGHPVAWAHMCTGAAVNYFPWEIIHLDKRMRVLGISVCVFITQYVMAGLPIKIWPLLMNMYGKVKTHFSGKILQQEKITSLPGFTGL